MATQTDLTFGHDGEQTALPQLREGLGLDLRPDPNKFARFDFNDEEAATKAKRGVTYVELKTRRCRKDRYPTTIVPASKIAWADQEAKFCKIANQPTPRFIFAFQFTDGLYTVEYPFSYDARVCKRRDRDRGTLHAYISCSLLQPCAASCSSDSVDEVDQMLAALLLG